MHRRYSKREQLMRNAAATVGLARTAGIRYVWSLLRGLRGFRAFDALARKDVYEGIWADAARDCGARLQPLGEGRFGISMGGSTVMVSQDVEDFDTQESIQRALDKVGVHQLLQDRGLQVPRHLVFEAGAPGPALEFLAAHGEVVLKPAAGSGAGSGVTTHITNASQLKRAITWARRRTPYLLVEEAVVGEMYRLLVLDGEVIDTYIRRSPRLVGNGKDTVIALMKSENLRRIAAAGAEGIMPLMPSLDAELTLARQGMSFSSVPPRGEVFAFKTITNEAGAKDSETFRGPLHESLRTAAIESARLLGLRLAGVDIVTADTSRSFADTGGAILEVNGTPGLYHHYIVADPEGATPVARSVLAAAWGASRR